MSVSVIVEVVNREQCDDNDDDDNCDKKYVEGNPISKVDPTGEFAIAPAIPVIIKVCESAAAGLIRTLSAAAIIQVVNCDNDKCEDKDDFCRKRKQYCFSYCQYELGFPGRTGHDNMERFRACVRKCMNEVGCSY
jgi:hypothetical protein